MNPMDNIEKLDDLLPDAVEIEQRKINDDYTRQTSQLKTECDDTVDNLISDIQSSITACKNECGGTYANCTSCYLSLLNDFSTQIESTLSKCKGLVSKSLQTKMYQTLEGIQSLGVSLPTEDQILERYVSNGGAKTKLLPSEALDLVHHLESVRCPNGDVPQTDVNNCPFCVVNASGDTHFPKLETLYLQSDFTWASSYDNAFCQLIAQATGITGKPPGGGTPIGGPGNSLPGSPPPGPGVPSGGTTVPTNPPPNNPPDSGSNGGTGGGGTIPNGNNPFPQHGSCPDGSTFAGYLNTGEPLCLTGIQGASDGKPPPDGVTGGTGGGAGGGGTGGGPGSPSIVDGECCYPPTKAEFLGCMDLTRPAEPYWVVITAANCANQKSCLYRGDLPPDVAPGDILIGPFLGTEQIQLAVEQAIKVCSTATPPPTSPPPPPLTPPPTNPLPPPPDTTESGTISEPTDFIDSGSCGIDWLVNRYKEKQNKDLRGQPDLTAADIEGYLCTTDINEPGGSLLDILSPTSAVFGGISALFGKNICRSYLAPLTASLLNFVHDVSKDYVCDNPEYYTAAIRDGILHFAGGIFGLIPEATRTKSEYDLNLVCQYIIPGLGELNNLSVRGFITDDQWKAAVAANGVCIPWARKLRDGGYTKPGVMEAIRLYNRDKLEEDELDALLEYNGVKPEDDKEQFKELAKYIPGPGDLVQFMVRDVFDPKVVTDLNLSNEFTTKFTGVALQWAKSQGISTEIMEKYWQSHWKAPGIGQAFDAFHRLREDKQIPGTNETAKAVTIEEIISLLKIDDVVPNWVNRVAYLSFLPLQKRDIRSLFERGELTEDEVTSAYQDLGYDKDNAESLKNWVVKITAEKRGMLDGTPSVQNTIRLYNADGIGSDVAKSYITSLGLSEEQAESIIRVADETRKAKTRAGNISALRNRYMQGEYDIGMVVSKLTDYGVNQDRVSEIVDAWKEQLQLKYKQPTISNLCKWTTLGYISPQDFVTRVQNLGYTSTDASNFVNSCVSDFAEKTAKAVKALVKEQQAATEKQRKEALATAKANAPCKPPPKPVCGTNGKPKTS